MGDINKLHRSDIIFLSVVFILFYILNRFSYSAADDYWYGFLTNSDGTLTRINSLGDAVYKQWQQYFEWGGRILVHSITSWFCGVGGMEAFKLCNSIVFIALLTGLIVLSRQYNGYRKNDKSLLTLLLFVLMPVQGTIFLGSIAMCVNYMWTSCAIVWFIVLYNKTLCLNDNTSVCRNIIYFIVALVVGSLQESFSVGLSMGLFVWVCMNFRNVKSCQWWLIIGFWLGTGVVTLAPGNFVRMGETSGNYVTGVAQSLSFVIGSLGDSILLLCLIVVSLFIAIKNRNKFNHFFRKYIVLYIAILFNVLIIALQYSGIRQLTSIELFSGIILIGFAYTFLPQLNDRNNKKMTAVICMVMLVIYIPVYSYRSKALRTYQTLFESKVEDNGIVDCEWLSMLQTTCNNRLFNKYAYTFPLEDWVIKGMSVVKTNGASENYIRTFYPKPIKMLAEEFESHNVDGIFKNESPVYYIFGNADRSNISFCEIVSEPKSYLGKIRNSLMNISSEYHIDITNQLKRFEKEGKIYYIFYPGVDGIIQFNWK